MTRPPRLSTARAELTRRIQHWFEVPLALLGAAWLGLLVWEFLHGSTPAIDAMSTAIWVVFVVEFATRLLLAPNRIRMLRANWLTALSLGLPALRVLRLARVFRLLRLTRGVRALRVARLLTSFSRGMRALGSTMHSRGFPYVVALTVLVLILGAAGMYAFERDAAAHDGFSTFTGSLWWTAMILTTMGSEYWPHTAEGRLVCLLLSIYAFAVFGYITATLASFFVGADAYGEQTRELDQQLRAIRAQLDELARLR